MTEGYEGEVTLEPDGEPPRTAQAALAARFDPLAGRVVWSGRVDLRLPPRTAFALTTPHGTARRGHRDRRLGQHPADRRRPTAVPGRAAGRRERCLTSAGQRDEDDGGDGGTEPGQLGADQPLA